jgi:hypothetical protein
MLDTFDKTITLNAKKYSVRRGRGALVRGKCAPEVDGA